MLQVKQVKNRIEDFLKLLDDTKPAMSTIENGKGNMIKIVFCPVGNKAEIRDLEPTLPAMQSLVGGFIECVRLGNRNDQEVSLWCNEDGKVNELPFNLRYPSDPRFPNDIICGNFFLASSDEDGETVSLNQRNLEDLVDLYQSPNSTIGSN